MSDRSVKAAIVTGSTRGIGRAIAASLAQANIGVVVNGTTEAGVNRTVAEIKESGGLAVGVTGRVEEMETGKKLTEAALDAFGRVDYLVNNAGIVADRMSHKLDEHDWDRVLAVHAKGTFACTQPFLQAKKEAGTGGVIINMTSLAGLHGVVGQLNYAAAKGAILAMTYTLAQEWQQAGIRVHAISPAALTDMTRPHVEKAEAAARAKGEELPDYWRIGQPEDVARLVLHLITHPTETGTVWGVNGNQIGLWSKPVYQQTTSE
ncbi:SDR family NAD(P)-dependent oxidoreductase [Brevibacillus fluminis]|uniref:SDR family NAD(P)-dependent oxidoreductase n=1 Tax=Brevibacillus fluminis TaxID=511487 RepID=UPI003F8AB8D5